MIESAGKTKALDYDQGVAYHLFSIRARAHEHPTNCHILHAKWMQGLLRGITSSTKIFT